MASIGLSPRLRTSGQQPFAGVNITNIRGVTVVGTGNIVNTELADLARLLTELEHEVGAAEALDETERLSALADLGTIQTQLSKARTRHRDRQEGLEQGRSHRNVGRCGRLGRKDWCHRLRVG